LDELEQRARFYDVVWPERTMVLRLALMLTRNDAEAEDLAQETLMKAFRHLDRFAAGTNIRAWLRKILRNTWTDRLRAAFSSSADISLEQAGVDIAAEASEQPVQWEMPEEIVNAFSDQQIIAALRELPDEIRWTLLLVDIEGLDHREAASVLEVPVGTIKSRAHRGRQVLRTSLDPMARSMRLIS
jgi:RNA polymerase sigma-70 factor, ECF subfamily